MTRVVAGSVTWSPDGRRIAFTARRAVGEPATIWVMNAEGGHVRRLELAPGISANNVDWSPVGSRLVFDTGGWVPKIYTVDADGGNLHLLTRNAASSEQPEWSANGRRIVFVRDHRVWTMNAYGRSPAGLTGEVGEAYPVWSPDGRKLAFVCWTTGDVYVMNADGTSRTKLEHNRLIERTLDWQPVAAP